MSNSSSPSNSPLTSHVSRLLASRFTLHASRLLASRLPPVLLALFIITYAGYFSWYTINRHNTLHSYAADLGLIDQPMWNTVLGPGDFMELTWGDHQQPRLAEHFEPILVPLALLFFLRDDVRILLVAQSVALALGALPVFWIARRELSIINSQHNPTPNPQSLISNLPSWAALAFAAAYLLFPPLQAANIADFHADPFVVAPLLFAFWYAGQKRWGWMWFWAVIVILTKENLPTLTAMLGIWLIATGDRRPETGEISGGKLPVPSLRSPVSQGLTLIFVSSLWFLIATFGIVAPLARQYFGTGGPIYLASRYSAAGLLAALQDPARWKYLLGLLTAAGFLPLLAPELLLLGLPVLLANFFSNFPGQYSGEQHYSAPLVVAVMLAAIYGSRRLINKASLYEKNGQSFKTSVLICVSLWLLPWAIGYHTLHGWTPLSSRMELYQMRPAAARLPDFIAQIPADAVVSASAAIQPHLAHRRVIYVFPTVQEADYLLVDVTDIPGVHPNDAHTKILNLLNTDWKLLQADQGLILAQKNPLRSPASLPPLRQAQDTACSLTLPLPCAFYDFVHPTSQPTYPSQLTFGAGRLQLLGYDVADDPDNGVTFRFYWQALDALPQDLRLWPLIYDDTGQLLSDPSQIPMVATIWNPPAAWQPGEIVVTETLPQLLPPIFHLGLAVGPKPSFTDPSQRYPVDAQPDERVQFFLGRWAQLATFQRLGPHLDHQPATLTLQALTPTQADFGLAIRLTGFYFDQGKLHPGHTVPLLFQWMANQPPPTDFTVFLHLVSSDGHLVAQNDAYPTWLTPQPTSQWPLHQPILDSHRLDLPADLSPGIYTLQIGLYDVKTLERLPLADGGDVFTLGQIEIE